MAAFSLTPALSGAHAALQPDAPLTPDFAQTWLAARVMAATQGHGVGAMLNQGQRNFETARELLIIQQSSHSDLHKAVALAKVGARWQAASLDLSWVQPAPLAGFAQPSAALKALAAREGIVLDSGQLAQLEVWDTWPQPLTSALARFVDAFLVFDAATSAAYLHPDVVALEAWLERVGNDPAPTPNDARVPVSVVPSAGPLLQDLGVDLAPVFSSRNQLLDAARGVADAWEATPPPALQRTSPLDMCPLFALDLAGVDSFYATDCILILDAGGHDTYYNNAGGSNLAGASCPDVQVGHAAALVDLGSGNDLYGNPVAPRYCGVNGGGYLGAGFLLDGGGADIYVAAGAGTNGGGTIGGTGFLLDVGGDDQYWGGGGATNGGGGPGAGFLLDLAGNDAYGASSGGTNGGGRFGVGFLFDGGGNDKYDAGSLGTNGGAETAGKGFLMDIGGDDRYGAGNQGANGSGDGGLGFLLDTSGLDSYFDGDDGSGIDRTVVPKGLVGAQVDAPG